MYAETANKLVRHKNVFEYCFRILGVERGGTPAVGMPIHTARVRALSSTSNNRHECIHSHPLNKESILHRCISQYVHGWAQCSGVVACTIHNSNRFSPQHGWVSAGKEGGWSTKCLQHTHKHTHTPIRCTPHPTCSKRCSNVIVFIIVLTRFGARSVFPSNELLPFIGYRLFRSFEENRHQQRLLPHCCGTFSTYTCTFFQLCSGPLQIALTRCTARNGLTAQVRAAFSAIGFGVTIEYFVRLSRKNVPIRTNARHNFGISLEWHPSTLITLAFYYFADVLGCCYQAAMAFRHKTSHSINQSHR